MTTSVDAVRKSKTSVVYIINNVSVTIRSTWAIALLTSTCYRLTYSTQYCIHDARPWTIRIIHTSRAYLPMTDSTFSTLNASPTTNQPRTCPYVPESIALIHYAEWLIPTAYVTICHSFTPYTLWVNGLVWIKFPCSFVVCSHWELVGRGVADRG